MEGRGGGTGGKKWSRFDDVVINSHGDYLVQGVLHNQPSLQNDVLAYNGIVLVTEGTSSTASPSLHPGMPATSGSPTTAASRSSG